MHKKLTKKQREIEWRQERILVELSKGKTQSELVTMFQVSQPTISRDIEILKQKSLESIKTHFNELPFAVHKSIVTIDECLKICWEIAENTDIESKDRISAINLILDCNNRRMEIMTDPNKVQGAYSYVSQIKEELEDKKRRLEDMSDKIYHDSKVEVQDHYTGN